MESRSAPTAPGPGAELAVFGPERQKLGDVPLSHDRVTVGRLPDANDIALQPDTERLVTRVAHCAFERDGGRWFVVDGGSVNGTFLRRDDVLERVSGRSALQDGDVVCVLASLAESGERTYFELAFHATGDSQATRAVAVAPPRGTPAECLSYDPEEARLLLVRGSEQHEIQMRAQAHRLVRYMAERNAAIGGAPALCTHDELMHAVWADEPMHTRTELAKLVWELRRQLEPFGAGHLIENERRRGYRIRTCPVDE
jgi:DNA-binding winged helix-turn-helix (wHTH) protein